MTEINLPQSNSDIFALGFDKSLNRAPESDLQTDDSGGSYSGVFSDPAQGIGFSAMATGSQSSMAVLDPSKGLWLGATTFAAAPFAVNMNGEMRATSGRFTGDITGATGTFSGTVSIGSLNIPDTTTANSFHVDSSGNTWWGANVATGSAGANAVVLNTGAATFKSVTLSTSVAISGIANNTSTDISLLEKTHTMVFTSASATQVNWTSGTVTLSNGRTFSISSGNTGSMAALTYIYVDPGVSSTVLQITTTAATALGANKILIGCAQNNTVTASYVPYGPGQPLVDGANIGALSIVAGNIAASTITGNKIAANTITAGNITAATITTTEIAATTITGANINTLNISGKTATFDTGTIGGFTMSSTTLSATNFTVTSGAANTARLTVGTGANLAGLNSANAGTDIAFWSGATFANRATAPFRVNAQGDLTATSVSISGVALTTQLRFGGTGADGAYSKASGTDTFSVSSSRYFVKNYTTISITGTGALAFSTPATDGTTIILNATGNVTITSSTNPCLDTRSMGGAGGTGGSGLISATSISTKGGGQGGGREAVTFNVSSSVGLGGGGGANSVSGSNGGVATGGPGSTGIQGFGGLPGAALTPYIGFAAPGGGGSGGSGGVNNAVTYGSGGNGGTGGGGLCIFTQGAYSASGVINTSGANGSNGTTSNSEGGGSGGGGAAGDILILYRTLTSDTATYTQTAGSAGTPGTDAGTGGAGAAGNKFRGVNDYIT